MKETVCWELNNVLSADAVNETAGAKSNYSSSMFCFVFFPSSVCGKIDEDDGQN